MTMRVLHALLCLWFSVLTVLASDARVAGDADCIRYCTALSVEQSSCAAADAKCRCTNSAVRSSVSSCILAHCDTADGIVATRQWASQCDRPHDNHHGALRAATVGGGVTGLSIVVGRVVARLCTVRRFWWDDWCHITAGVLTVAIVVFSSLCVDDGMGYHLYDIQFSSVSQAHRLTIWYYLCQIFWLLIIYFIKMSVLFLYLRIFPEIHHFQLYVIATMTLLTCSVVILVPMDIWQCVPIHAIWEFRRDDARCLSIAGVAYASAAVNIATELAIFILPLPLLRTLRTSRSQKLALYALFGCGIVVIAIASARVPSLKHVEAINDPTYLNVEVIYWTCAETSVAHLCAAASAFRPLYVKLRNMFRERRMSVDSTAPDGLGTDSASKSGHLPGPNCRQVEGFPPGGGGGTHGTHGPLGQDAMV